MIHIAEKQDYAILANLAILMWSDHSVDELINDFEKILSDDEARCFVKYEGDVPVGFAQCQLRHDYVEGTETSPVGYLEGIFVKEPFRHKGYAGELLTACERWAREKGCREFASDCELDNNASYLFHRAMNFKEANRIICFAKEL